MIREVVKKELREQLFTFRFIFGLALCLIVFPIFTLLLGENYQLRYERYQTKVQENEKNLSGVLVYSNISPTVYRPPGKLSVICQGIEEQLPGEARITLTGVEIPPRVMSEGGRRVDNRYSFLDKKYRDMVIQYAGSETFMAAFSATPLTRELGFKEIFPSFDLVFLATFIFSLLAIFFGYNAVSGERETATLKMIMSTHCSRFQLILGKVISGFASLAVIILAGFISGMVVLVLSYNMDFSIGDWVLIVLIYLTTILFAFVFYNIGVLFSTFLRRSYSALFSSLGVWIFLAVCYPILVGSLIENYVPLAETDEVVLNADDLLVETSDKVMDLQQKFKFPEDERRGIRWDMDGPMGHYLLLVDKPNADRYVATYPHTEPLWIGMGNRMIEAMEGYYGRQENKTRHFSALSWLNPVQAYKEAAMGFSGTDKSEFYHFYDQAKRYRRTICDYLTDKKAFSQVRYIIANDLPLEDFPKDSDEFRKVIYNYVDRETREIIKLPLPIADTPRFTYQQSGFAPKLEASVSGFGRLILINFFLIILSTAIMSKVALN